MFNNTVELLLSDHSREQDNWSLHRAGENKVGRGPVFSLSNIGTNKCK